MAANGKIQLRMWLHPLMRVPVKIDNLPKVGFLGGFVLFAAAVALVAIRAGRERELGHAMIWGSAPRTRSLR